MADIRIPISRPWFGAEEKAAVQRPLESGWVVQGPFVADFEARFARFVDAPFAAATTSCTAALQLAVAALGLSPGDEVIVPALTWIATSNVVEYMGAKPVFCDVDLATFNLDVAHAASLVTPRTVGIIPVHLFGLCADMDGVGAIAARHGLWVVEDAACGLGARIRGRHAGTFATAGCFSFHPRKAITTGEGGMVTSESTTFDARIRSLRDHGASRADGARHTSAGAFLLPPFELLGYNLRMTDIQGALGVVQIGRAEGFLAERRAQAARYDTHLSALPWLATPRVPADFEHGYQSYVCLFQPAPPTLETVDRLHERRNELMARLEAQGIATRQGTHAPPFTGYYTQKYGYRPGDFPRAYLAEKLSLSLPIFAGLADSELGEVCTALAAAGT